MDQAVIASRPEHAALDWRLGEREDRAVVLRAGVVLGDWSAGGAELAFVVAREVGADALPGRPLVGGSEDAIAGRVQDVRVVRRVHDRRGPLESVPQRLGALACARLGPDHDVARLPGAPVVARQDALIVPREDDVRIIRADRDVSGLAPTDREAVGAGDPRDGRSARDGHRGVVLLRSIDAIRRLGIGQDVIELGRRLVVHG